MDGRYILTTHPAVQHAEQAHPQTNFALESAVDMLAEKLGIDPLEFRRMNSLKPGQTKATGMLLISAFC